MNNHTTNEHKGIPNFSYISFDKAYELAENFLKFGGSGTMKDLCKIFNLKYKTGWLGLQIKSLRSWGLLSGKGKMSLTERFYKIAKSSDQNEKCLIKGTAFLEIPLFKIIFDRYSKKGIPIKSELINILESEYNISPRYSSPVANSIIESLSNYFKEYGKNITIPEVEIKKDMVMCIDDLAKKRNLINIKIASPIGNFNFEATNKEEFRKILKVINALWNEEDEQSHKQKTGDTRQPDERRSPAE